MINHPFPPLFDGNSEKLILGSFPSVASREHNFYYGFSLNRFWLVLAGVFNKPVPETVDEKKKFILSHRIALWDVISSCDIEKSSDKSIKNAAPNDIVSLIKNTNIRAVYLNGAVSYELYKKFFSKKIDLPAFKLPSTSPLNAAFSLEELIKNWRIIDL